jgi:hypothetical protein
MTKYPELYSIVKEEDAEVSGVRCLVFAYSEPYAEEDSTTLISKVARRLWIDPNTALIMKMENYRGDKRAGLMMEVLSTSVSKGLVYPKKFAITFSGKEKDKCLYEVTSFVPNPALKDSDFSKSFPSGTRVIDQELGISYIQP